MDFRIKYEPPEYYRGTQIFRNGYFIQIRYGPFWITYKDGTEVAVTQYFRTIEDAESFMKSYLRDKHKERERLQEKKKVIKYITMNDNMES